VSTAGKEQQSRKHKTAVCSKEKSMKPAKCVTVGLTLTSANARSKFLTDKINNM